MNLFITNLPPSTTHDDLKAEFEPYGEVTNVTIMRDAVTGRSRGMAFMEMPNMNEAFEAISKLNGSVLQGRIIMVSEARDKAWDRKK